MNPYQGLSLVACDVPPIDPPPLSPSSLGKLHKQRLHNQRLRSSVQEERDACVVLRIEEERLREKVVKGEEVVLMLSDRSQILDSQYKDLEELYRTNVDRLRTLHKSMKDVEDQWKKDSAKYNTYVSQLKRLRAELPVLTEDLAKAASKCSQLSGELRSTLEEQKNLQLKIDRTARSISKLEKENVFNVSDNATQTRCDFTVFEELETVKKEVANQITAMKHVKKTIDVIRRCP